MGTFGSPPGCRSRPSDPVPIAYCVIEITTSRAPRRWWGTRNLVAHELLLVYRPIRLVYGLVLNMNKYYEYGKLIYNCRDRDGRVLIWVPRLAAMLSTA